MRDAPTPAFHRPHTTASYDLSPNRDRFAPLAPSPPSTGADAAPPRHPPHTSQRAKTSSREPIFSHQERSRRKEEFLRESLETKALQTPRRLGGDDQSQHTRRAHLTAVKDLERFLRESWNRSEDGRSGPFVDPHSRRGWGTTGHQSTERLSGRVDWRLACRSYRASADRAQGKLLQVLGVRDENRMSQVTEAGT